MSSRYHIIYPRGERDKLAVVEIVGALSYELNDYAVASRHDYSTYQEAANYAKSLAKEHDKTFVPDSDENDFLD